MRIAAFAALALLSAAPLSAGLFDDDDCRYSAPRKAVVPAGGVTKVVIHGMAGSLTVTGTPGASQVVASGTACTSDDDFVEKMTLTARRSGSEVHIEATIPEKSVFFGFFSARLDFTVALPAGIPVSIDDGSGWMKVSGTGPTEIEDGSGSIEVRDVRGPLRIDDGSGSIEIDGARDIRIDDQSGDIVVRNVTGNVELEDGSGSIVVEKVTGSVHVLDDGSGSIDIRNVRGNAIIDEDGSGTIDVADVGGDFTVGRKGSGSIDQVRVSGRVSVPRDRD